MQKIVVIKDGSSYMKTRGVRIIDLDVVRGGECPICRGPIYTPVDDHTFEDWCPRCDIDWRDDPTMNEITQVLEKYQ